MEHRDITIHRNVIENAIMASKEFIKNHKRPVLYSVLGLLVALCLFVAGYMYYESRATADLAKFEQIMDRYRQLRKSSTESPAGAFVVIEELKGLVESSSWGFVRDNGNYVIAGLYFDEKKYGEAKEYYLKYAEEKPRSEFAILAIQKAAVSAENLGYFDDALRLYQRLERDYGDTTYADQICYDLARMYQKKGDLFKSKEYFHKVVSTYPRSIFSPRSRHRLFLLSYQEKKIK